MQIGIFAEETQFERLSRLGDSLEKLKVVDFESLRPLINEGIKKTEKASPADRLMTA